MSIKLSHFNKVVFFLISFNRMRTIISDSENENNLTLGSDYRLSVKGALRP